MLKQSLEHEQATLLNLIADLEARLNQEQSYFLGSGNRTVAAQTWKQGTANTVLEYKKQLVEVMQALRDLEEPEEKLQQLIKGMSWMALVKIWWRA